MSNTEMADQVLKTLIDLFKKGDVAKLISQVPMAIKDPNDHRACWNWSLRNRLLMVGQGSFDSRNSTEWKKFGRAPKDWKKTIRILKPNLAYLCALDKGFMRYNKFSKSYKCVTCNQEIKGIILALKEKKVISFVRGYAVQAEYDIGNTYDICGKGKIEPYEPAKKPALFNLAQELGLNITYQTDPTGKSYGHVKSNSNTVTLGTEDPQVFYHELVHKVDQKINLNGKLKSGQDPSQEIVAELTSCVLAKMYNEDDHAKFTFEYIEMYAKKQKLTIEKAINQILNRIDKILKYIFETVEKLNKNQKGIIVSAWPVKSVKIP